MEFKFDMEIKTKFKDGIIIEYGVIKGNDRVVFIKAGQDGSYKGYENKYLRMAVRLNNKYGCTVVTSSNPFDGDNPLDNAMDVIESLVGDANSYEVYYLGFSNGGIIGLQFATYYSQIKKIVSVNAPLMINFYKTKRGILDFRGEKIVLVYGSEDLSIRYVSLLEGINKSNMDVVILENEDHYISKNFDDFYLLVGKYFFG